MMQYESSSEDEEDGLLLSLNISNDQYYRPRLKLKIKRQPQQTVETPTSFKQRFVPPSYGSKTIRHSIPAYDLWKAFFPTYLNHEKFCNFHRPKLRHYNTGPQSRTSLGYNSLPIKNLTPYIYKHHRELRSRVLRALEKGYHSSDIINSFLLISHAKDLSAKSGEIFLLEYSEEYPPILGQVGMASNIKNYLAPSIISGLKSKTNSKDNKTSDASESMRSRENEVRIGYREEPVREPPSHYFCPMKTGSKAQFIENNMYRGPIFRHEPSNCDFLVIRTRNNLYVRSINNLYTVGQTMPLIEVAAPNEAKIGKFRTDLSNLYIHKLFAASETDPPSMKLDYLAKLFPDYDIKTLRRRMYNQGAESAILYNERVIQQGLSNYGKLPWARRCKIMTPEQYCSYMSALAARERLRELNYTESMINPDSKVNQLEPEILAAPWNTSKAVISLMKGQSFLDLRKHLIDPTGAQREGFSCVVWSRSPTEEQQVKESRMQRTFGAQKRNLPITFGKNPLLNQIKSEKLERLAIFRKEAQLLVDTQAKVLSCAEALSSSEDEDEGENCENDQDFIRQMNDLESLVFNGRTISMLAHEKEEQERLKMMQDLGISKKIMNNHHADPLSENLEGDSQTKSTDMVDLDKYKGKVMMITRTYNIRGQRMQRKEIVREPKVIALYSKYKDTTAYNNIGNNDDENQAVNCSLLETRMRSSNSHSPGTQNQGRPRSASLGPSELCRADGMRLRISKKVLEDLRPLRACRRESAAG